MSLTLFTRQGTPKLVDACTYPLTRRGCVSRVGTDVLLVTPAGIEVRETYGTTATELAQRL
ncbi:hypothetical protein SGFS_022010 [Streptomyces graminofaciens]|uniref:Uncharacterized protein n=1 Tax=Streptomyces graminofaciens TaxID=68212 RepID=A0ABN5VCH1_9ACTN|nr:hypothetical protein [Streptomyces graminofaciens]BBC30907.1 hypothetical protein SGFS_022010 [Streptomyces graminofaciens]